MYDVLLRLLEGSRSPRTAPPQQVLGEPRQLDDALRRATDQICWGCGTVLEDGQEVWPLESLCFCSEVCRKRYQRAARRELARRMGLDPDRR